MSWQAAEGHASGGSDDHGTAHSEGSSEPPGEEHLGPISFTRSVKDDGRMLIVYRRSRDRDG
jgi:hypothetical protein